MAYTHVDSDTTASIGDGAAINQNGAGAASRGVNVAASNFVSVRDVAGAVAVSTGGGIAGGVNVGLIRNSVEAFIGEGATVLAEQDVEVRALAIKTSKVGQEYRGRYVRGSGGRLGLDDRHRVGF